MYNVCSCFFLPPHLLDPVGRPQALDEDVCQVEVDHSFVVHLLFPTHKIQYFFQSTGFPLSFTGEFLSKSRTKTLSPKKKEEAAFFFPSPRDNRGKAQKYFSLHSTTQNYPHTRKKHMQSGKECSTDLFPCRRRGPD